MVNQIYLNPNAIKLQQNGTKSIATSMVFSLKCPISPTGLIEIVGKSEKNMKVTKTGTKDSTPNTLKLNKLMKYLPKIHFTHLL